MKLGRFFQIDVYLHWTFLAALAYLFYELKVRRGLAWGPTGMVMLFAGVLFLCVLLHEYGHALAARAFKVETLDIILTPIGGMARFTHLPKRPVEELLITVAGPAVNLGIAAVVSIYILATTGEWTTQTGTGWSGFIPLILSLNITLFWFNLIPAYPMDGGRILRSSLAFFMSHETATKIAATVGQICAVGLLAYALSNAYFITAAIAVFIFFLARKEANSASPVGR